LLLCEWAQQPVIVAVLDGDLLVMDMDGTEMEGSHTEVVDVQRMTCSGSEIAYVSQQMPTTVNIIQLGVMGQVAYDINATAPVQEDDVLAAWGTPVDMNNASIESMTFNREYLAVTVNVSATDRLVLYNRSSAVQWLASNPKYHVYDPSLNYDILAWSVRDHLNPLTPQNKYLDREIYFLELDTNTTQVLTSDSSDQWGPQVLEHHLVYFQQEGDVQTVEIHSWEPELRLYSSLVLQAGVLSAFVVVAWNMWQRQKERTQRPQA
jgi:hypothetical protein